MSSRLLYKYICYQFSYRYTLEDIMAKLLGHFTMRIPKLGNKCFKSNLLFSLTCVLFISGVTLPVCNAQNGTNVTPASTLQGICNIDQLPDPCVVGETYGDPGDCTAYYECTTGTNALSLQHCEAGSKYDYRKKKCRVDKPDLKRAIRCEPECKKDRKNKQTAPPVPTLRTDNGITKRSENATSAETQSITEPNEALTTEDDDTVKAAGDFKKDNDTVVPAVVPDQGAGAPSGVANTTSVETTEGTEAQTEEEDVITTATPTTTTPPPTPAPTLPPTPPPSTKSTAKSTTTTQPGIVVVETDGDPGYDIVSTAPNNSSGSAGVDESKDDGVSTAQIGIAVGIIIAILIVSVVVFLLICHIRKKKYSKEKQIVNIENPKYKKEGGDKHAYRFSRDASLLVNEKPANNNSTEKLAFIPGRKRPAPVTPSKDKSKEKRKAPPPPNPFTGEIEDDDFRPPTFRKDSSDLYERDTDGSGDDIELSTFSAPTSSFGTGTGTFGKGKNFGKDTNNKNKATQNGRLQTQPSTRSTDYSSSDENDSDEEEENLLGRKYKSTDIDDAVFKEDSKPSDVNNSMDAYLSAYDQALK